VRLLSNANKNTIAGTLVKSRQKGENVKSSATTSIDQPVETRNIFKSTFAEEYELALREGERRFGSGCRHDHIKDGVCLDCYRKVVSR